MHRMCSSGDNSKGVVTPKVNEPTLNKGIGSDTMGQGLSDLGMS